jgi:antitoxin component YwqK of YwqJK toxin-antitoxin module
MKFTTIKRLGLPSGLIAAVLAVSSCAEIAMVPAGVVAVPLVAVFFAGFVGVATLSQVMEGFDAQEREREAKPRKDGPFIEYWVNGKKSAVGTYKNKKLDGVYTEYFKSGKKKSELTYVGGERNGPYTSWFESGQKSVEGTFKAGKEYGTTKCYHENGKMSYLKGHGPNRNETTWHKNGQRESVTKYKNGKLIFRQAWDDKGKELEELRRMPD